MPIMYFNSTIHCFGNLPDFALLSHGMAAECIYYFGASTRGLKKFKEYLRLLDAGEVELEYDAGRIVMCLFCAQCAAWPLMSSCKQYFPTHTAPSIVYRDAERHC